MSAVDTGEQIAGQEGLELDVPTHTLPGRRGFFDLGGKQPQTGVLKLTKAEMALAPDEVPAKGSTVTLVVTGVVRGIGQIDKADKETGVVVESTEVYRVEVTGMEFE